MQHKQLIKVNQSNHKVGIVYGRQPGTYHWFFSLTGLKPHEFFCIT